MRFSNFLQNKKYSPASSYIYPCLYQGGLIRTFGLIGLVGATPLWGGSLDFGKKIIKNPNIQKKNFDSAGLNFILNEALSLIGHGLIAFRWPDIAFQNIEKNGHFRPKKIEIPATGRRKPPSQNFWRTNTTPGT